MIEAKSNIKVSALGLFEELKKEKKKLIASKTILDKKDNHEYPIADIPFEIPSHWIWCYLSDISLIQEGPGIRKHQYETSGVQFLTVTNILEGSVDLEKSKKYISKEQYKNYSHFTINKGDIVTACSGGSWGKSAIYELDEKLILNTSTLRLRFYNDLGENYYLYYLTKTSYFKDSLSKYITGQQPNYGYSHYSKIPIPLPPLPEQQRIVAILDEAFAAIAKARENAEQNLKNAKELFESYLQGVFENSDWETKTLGEIGDPKMCKRILKHQTNTTGEIPFYKIGTFGKTPDAFISKEIYDEYRTKYSFPKKGDILISASGTIGRRVRYDGEPAFFQDSNIVWIDNNEKQVLNDYLYVFYEFCDWQPSKGATISRLYNSNLTSIKIVFPKSLEEQKTILKKINAVSAETKKLEAIYQQKINDLEELKKSVLQKAFSGELKTNVVAV
jgi:type I restriction enzyme S subunit